MKRLIAVLQTSFGVALVACILLISFKSCIVTLWEPPSEPTAYQVSGADGREMVIVLMPNRDALVGYQDSQAVDLVRIHMRGSYATHYLGPVWNVSDEGGSWFGLRFYRAGIKPVTMELEVKQKAFSGRGETAFDAIGSSSRATVLFTSDSLHIWRMWLRRVPADPTLIAALAAALR